MNNSDLSSFISARCFDVTSAANSSSSSYVSTSVAKNKYHAGKKSNKNLKTQSSLASSLSSLSSPSSRRGRKKTANGSTKSQSRTTSTRYPSKGTSSRHCTAAAGTSIISNSPDRVLCCIFEISKDIGTRIGMCIINYNTGELILSDFMDSQIYIRTIHKIQVHQPTEILLPSSSLSPVVSKLATIIKFNVSDAVKINETSVRYFNSTDGLTAISKYIMENDEKNLRIEKVIDKTFALNATAAAMSYTNEIVSKATNYGVIRFKKYRIKYECTENTMLIDPKTIRGLELVENNVDKKGLSFWKFMDSTSTKMGQRFLRNNILQPLTDKESIEMRLEAVKELESDTDLLDSLRAEMKLFQDLDKLFAKLLSINQAAVRSEQKINYAILLKSSIIIAKAIQRLLNETEVEARLLKETRQIFSSECISEIEEYINKYINEDCTWASSNLELENQRSYAVKSGANGLLDVSRQIYKNTIDEIMQEFENISKTYDMRLDYNFDASHGFYMKIKRHDIADVTSLPEMFINRVVKKNHIECTTLSTVKANARLKEVMSEISIISEQVVGELLGEIVKNISTLFMISEAVSILDLLCCFAYNARAHKYSVPQFSNKMILHNSRHPILDTLKNDFVPNEISSTKNSSSVQIITGCNMSGKSVYLRQVVLLSIMAQMGSEVPADYACFKIYTKIHARVCNDSMELCSSNFAFEMKELAYFLDDVDSTTLLVLDELGRGSSIGDGFCISLAVTEYLLKTKCTVFLSTHFQDIPNILKYKPCVRHLNMRAEIDSDSSMTMHYKLSDSLCTIENPGIRTVSKMFSPEIIERAYEIGNKLSADKLKNMKGRLTEQERIENIKTVNQMKKIHNLVELLQGYIDDDMQLSLESLKAVQSEFIKSFER